MSGEVREQPDPAVQADLATWLVEQVQADEETAQAAHDPDYEWGPTEATPRAMLDDARHIGRWSPARVLAECETRRRTIELHSDTKHLAFEVR